MPAPTDPSVGMAAMARITATLPRLSRPNDASVRDAVWHRRVSPSTNRKTRILNIRRECSRTTEPDQVQKIGKFDLRKTLYRGMRRSRVCAFHAATEGILTRLLGDQPPFACANAFSLPSGARFRPQTMVFRDRQ